jgi:hypothetical protein
VINKHATVNVDLTTAEILNFPQARVVTQ